MLVIDGYGVKVHCLRGRLVVEDGIGPERRSAVFHRATAKLKRLVLLRHEGFVTLEALRWLDDVGAAFVHIDRNGRLLATSAGLGRDDPRLRRAQALAADTATGAAVARYLLGCKLRGQAALLGCLGAEEGPAGAINGRLAALGTAPSSPALMSLEAGAALAYWEAWSRVEVRFVRADQPKVPDHWRTFGKRVSPLTGNPRLAGNPANAILNYLYAIAEAECRIACLAIGLDPGLASCTPT